MIYALGTTANPIIAQTTPGLETNKWGYIDDRRAHRNDVDPGLFAGGDIVTGAATVILAMGAGRRAARGMLEYMGVDAEASWSRIRCHPSLSEMPRRSWKKTRSAARRCATPGAARAAS